MKKYVPGLTVFALFILLVGIIERCVRSPERKTSIPQSEVVQDLGAKHATVHIYKPKPNGDGYVEEIWLVKDHVLTEIKEHEAKVIEPLEPRKAD